MICIGEPPIEMEASMVPLLTSRKDIGIIAFALNMTASVIQPVVDLLHKNRPSV